MKFKAIGTSILGSYGFKNGNSAYGEKLSKITGFDGRNKYNCRLGIQLQFSGLRNELAINFNSVSVKGKGKPSFLQSSVRI